MNLARGSLQCSAQGQAWPASRRSLRISDDTHLLPTFATMRRSRPEPLLYVLLSVLLHLFSPFSVDVVASSHRHILDISCLEVKTFRFWREDMKSANVSAARIWLPWEYIAIMYGTNLTVANILIGIAGYRYLKTVIGKANTEIFSPSQLKTIMR